MFKTIVLSLLESHPILLESLKQSRQLLTTMNAYAADLRAQYLIYRDTLKESSMDEATASSRAMEMAVADLQQHLSPIESVA